MSNLAKKLLNRSLRKNRVRAKVSRHCRATTPDCHDQQSCTFSAQLIDDDAGKTLVSAQQLLARKQPAP